MIEAGVARCENSGQPLAVVSIIGGDLKVVASFARAQDAKPFRTRYGRSKGFVSLSEIKGLVLVVRKDGYLV